MKIKQSTIALIRERTNILDIASEYLALRQRTADEHIGLCPFHQENSPSFTVNSTKGVFYCFGCQESGDTISFVMKIGGKNFTEAIADLAQRYSVDLEPETESADFKQWQETSKHKAQLIEVAEAACVLFQSWLTQSTKAKDYLRSRNITPQTANKFRLGYACDSYYQLLETLGQRYPVELLVELGLVKSSTDKLYDFFRDRLIVPLFDPQGRAVGFSGRTLGSAKAKYLNSPESLIFEKNKILYPIHLARTAIVKQDVAILVEGNFDAISLHQNGFNNAIASLGTSCTPESLNTLANIPDSKNIILALDSDRAGMSATDKIIKSSLPGINSNLLNLKVLALPEGFKDTDELLATDNGRQILDTAIATAPTWVDWYISIIRQRFDLTKGEDFKQCLMLFANLLQTIENKSLQQFYVERLGSILGSGNPQASLVHANTLRQMCDRSKNTSLSKPTDVASKDNSFDLYTNLDEDEIKILSCELLAAKILIFCPDYRSRLCTSLTNINWSIKDPVCKWLFNLFQEQKEIYELDRDYAIVEIQHRFTRILKQKDTFLNIPEFANLDYYQERDKMQNKLNRILSKTKINMLKIERPDDIIQTVINQLYVLILKNKLKVIQVLLSIDDSELVVGSSSKKTKYCEQINQIKQEIEELCSSH